MAAPTWTYGEASVGAVIAGVLTLACMAGCGPSDGGGITSFSASSSTGWASGGSSSSAAAGNPPVVVLVDPDRTLTAKPGQGVGVFTEYATGGHWHVWWTCDTAVNGTGDPCFFQVEASVSSGAITSSGGGDPVSRQTSQDIEATTTTSTGLDQIYFDTTPGQAIELDVRLNGVRDGRFLFFVQNGVVNGGYTGTLSDPLVLSPAL